MTAFSTRTHHIENNYECAMLSCYFTEVARIRESFRERRPVNTHMKTYLRLGALSNARGAKGFLGIGKRMRWEGTHIFDCVCAMAKQTLTYLVVWTRVSFAACDVAGCATRGGEVKGVKVKEGMKPSLLAWTTEIVTATCCKCFDRSDAEWHWT